MYKNNNNVHNIKLKTITTIAVCVHETFDRRCFINQQNDKVFNSTQKPSNYALTNISYYFFLLFTTLF